MLTNRTQSPTLPATGLTATMDELDKTAQFRSAYQDTVKLFGPGTGEGGGGTASILHTTFRDAIKVPGGTLSLSHELFVGFMKVKNDRQVGSVNAKTPAPLSPHDTALVQKVWPPILSVGVHASLLVTTGFTGTELPGAKVEHSVSE